jgi:hypothetical protein
MVPFSVRFRNPTEERNGINMILFVQIKINMS